jgi:hypothetical protein
VWIYGDNWTVKRTEMWAGNTKMMTADWSYSKVRGFYLPSVIKTAFVGGGRMGGGGHGTVQLTFSGWRVNTGLKDSIFPKQEGPRGFGPGGGGQWGQHRRWDQQQQPQKGAK